MLQTKYTLIDEQDIPLVESFSFEVSAARPPGTEPLGSRSSPLLGPRPRAPSPHPAPPGALRSSVLLHAAVPAPRCRPAAPARCRPGTALPLSERGKLRGVPSARGCGNVP